MFFTTHWRDPWKVISKKPLLPHNTFFGGDVTTTRPKLFRFWTFQKKNKLRRRKLFLVAWPTGWHCWILVDGDGHELVFNDIKVSVLDKEAVWLEAVISDSLAVMCFVVSFLLGDPGNVFLLRRVPSSLLGARGNSWISTPKNQDFLTALTVFNFSEYPNLTSDARLLPYKGVRETT